MLEAITHVTQPTSTEMRNPQGPIRERQWERLTNQDPARSVRLESVLTLYFERIMLRAVPTLHCTIFWGECCGQEKNHNPFLPLASIRGQCRWLSKKRNILSYTLFTLFWTRTFVHHLLLTTTCKGGISFKVGRRRQWLDVKIYTGGIWERRTHNIFQSYKYIFYVTCNL